MVERIKRKPDGRRNNGGRREGAGPKLGTIDEAKRVARARAKITGSGLNPHELLRLWADTGYMEFTPGQGMGRKRKFVELTPGDRISCAKGCAAYYQAPLSSVKVTGDAEQPVVVHLDDRILSALAKDHPDKLSVLREVLAAVGGEGLDLSQLQAPGAKADPSRYAEMLKANTQTQGRA